MIPPRPIHVDCCVIGGGAAGLSVAAGAVQLGFDVALVEQNRMGGECLYTGCIPSKSLLATARAAHTIRSAEKYGIAAQNPAIDFHAVGAHINGVICAIEPHDSPERFEAMGVKVFHDTATFIARDTILAGPQQISARYFVLATGARPHIPQVDGLDPAQVLTNETAFSLTELPPRLLIIGAGPVGVEMAQAFHRLGSKVMIVDHGPLLPHDDRSMAELLRDALAEDGIRIFENIEIERIEHRPDGILAFIRQGGDRFKLEATHLLCAAGRKPNLEILALDKAGVDVTCKGITVDRRLRTSNHRIYAAGDIVVGAPHFTHIAGYHAGIIIRNMVFKIPAKTDYRAVPWVTYTDPELAHCGLTEDRARDKHGDKIRTVRWKFKENDRAQAEREITGGIKLVLKKNGEILGATILGPHAGELIGLWSLAISQKMKIGAIAGMIAPYPTYGEISKRAASAHFTPSLFSERTRFFTGLLQRLSF